MVVQNPDLIRVQNIPKDYLALQFVTEINWLKEKFGIKQQYNYLFYKVVDNDIVSIYGSYGYSDVSEVYHVMGERI